MSMISGLLEYLRGDEKKSATVAKERLQIILAHERCAGRNSTAPNFIPALQEELLTVIAKYIHVDRKLINVNLEKHGEYDVLEVNITLPEKFGTKKQ